jgi:hypothetical protein
LKRSLQKHRTFPTFDVKDYDPEEASQKGCQKGSQEVSQKACEGLG